MSRECIPAVRLSQHNGTKRGRASCKQEPEDNCYSFKQLLSLPLPLPLTTATWSTVAPIPTPTPPPAGYRPYLVHSQFPTKKAKPLTSAGTWPSLAYILGINPLSTTDRPWSTRFTPQLCLCLLPGPARRNWCLNEVFPQARQTV